MNVSEWIDRYPSNAITVSPESSLQQVIERLLKESCLRDIYVISEEKKVMGYLSHKKLVKIMLSEHQSILSRRQIMDRVTEGKAGELMNINFTYARPDEKLDEVLQRQIENNVEDMPVINEEGMLLGAVNMTSVLRAFHEGGIE